VTAGRASSSTNGTCASFPKSSSARIPARRIPVSLSASQTDSRRSESPRIHPRKVTETPLRLSPQWPKGRARFRRSLYPKKCLNGCGQGVSGRAMPLRADVSTDG
jgi:hypothetical protein